MTATPQKTFSPSEAALSVFELMKRQPQFVLKFCIIFALTSMAGFGLMVAMGVGAVLQEYLAYSTNNPRPDPERLLEILSPAYGGLMAVSVFIGLMGIFTTTMALRKTVRDEDQGLFGLQLGPDELRLFLAKLALMGLICAASFLVGLVISILSLISKAAGIRAFPIFLIALLVVSVRFAFYGVVSIAERRVGVMSSWQVTQGQIFRVLGALLLWTIISIILGLIFSIVSTLGASLLGAKVGTGFPENIGVFLSPGWLFYALMTGLTSGLTNLGYICIGAYAWHQMRGDLPTRGADVF